MGRLWLQPPRRLLTSFLLVVVACVGALAWLGYRLLDQDRALESQRARDELELTSDLTAAAMDRKLAILGAALDGPPDKTSLPDEAVLLVASAQNLETHGARRLLFESEFEAPTTASDDRLSRAELVEFREKNPLAAAALFRDVARSKDPAVRAAALVRLGRSLRKAGRVREALETYAELAVLGPTRVSGLPAELLAREARCSTLEASGETGELQREAAALLRDLYAGRWRITRSAYEFRAEEARRWIGDGAQLEAPADLLALSVTAADLVDAWCARPAASGGRHVSIVDSRPVLTVWRATSATLTAVIAGPDWLNAAWAEAVPDGTMRLTLTDPDGRTIFGTLPGSAERVAVRTAAVTRLPWTIHLSGTGGPAPVSGMAARRQLLLAGLSVLGVLLVVSSAFIVRAMNRELAVAKLQSEFVASVSHEFRSPLTSIRQLSSMLVQGRLPSDEQRQRSYEFLAGEAGRLERLIEGLLDFGLMEAGGVHYRLERTDARDIVRDTVAAFQRTVAAKGPTVELCLPAADCTVLADRDALGRAIWNLLDNAVKYSPGQQSVRVDAMPRGDRLAIAVSDRGIGIPAAEQRTIFQKFFRGANSREAGIKGTGIGLAMVKHIVAAHRGAIELESAPGEGSRFTILIPMETGT